MSLIIATPTTNFLSWLFHDRSNRPFLLLAPLVIIVSFIWVKMVYPYPNFIPPDSFSYLEVAQRKQFISFWPVGYSFFLRMVAALSRSHFLLVLLQYLFLQTSILYFLFTVKYFFSTGRWISMLFFGLCMMNPLLPLLSNYVSSDALFTSLSIVWLTQLVWILHRPLRRLLFFHAIVIVLAVMVRHYALYFPLFSSLVLFFQPISFGKKMVAILPMTLLLLTYIGLTQYAYYKETGKVQYSAFGNWQLASNALYGYAYANDSIPNPQVRAKFQELHRVTNQQINSIQRMIPRPDGTPGIYYLWNENGPLKKYMRKRLKEDTLSSEFQRWAKVAPLYSAYGKYLIYQRPGPFLKHYIWPNFISYYTPPPGFMRFYNLRRDTVDKIAVQWFNWANNRLPARTGSRDIPLTNLFPVLIALMNVLFLASIMALLLMIGFKNSLQLANGTIWLVFLLWITNMFFSVISAPIELRYQIFPMVFTSLFLVVWLHLLVRHGKVTDVQKTTLPPRPVPATGH